ncbi:related to potato small nuclear ribonucleoprotein U2B and human splicing factor homolog [Fusarium fujikuroi]|uniref:Related to potato small nuclear ribonucleoprotein U2B and human splicing factor homolog n=2 Tax=Fusarium fujikuroi TaxID=5127 RepID=S0E7Q9_GIBF5|nr:U2B-like small nuclear ribonucleo protein [Fusarium fujikuroi IMI 58289]KLO84488.1 small nuclear ribonucleoprotein [Fusarium fujikuroi]KLP11321.1 small nuclear ribonucleoprotein [Fusarium fujikuroi]KLP14432.1 small nuclear ribonucleoprotein [Fusarium fujikuroi]QGI65649.1 hypothetical protein CEK27_009620 [Fusarium fujikuroi]QGI82896.1 hypothetical protein CEK25_009625 [Fusarium fujikuroi]
MKSKRAREAAEVDDKPIASVDSEAPAKKRKRSEDDGADLKKAKKEKRDKKYKKESRKERKEKRKNLQDLPEQDDDEEAAEDAPMVEADDKPADAPVEADKPAKKDKKKNKDKKAKTDESQQKDDASADAQPEEKPKEEPKKSKKDKKKQNKTPETTTTNDESAAGVDAEAADGKGDRHIVFVGNLPFTATAETIKAHFASLNPVSVRCMSDPKDSKPCRGFAFVEFEKVWHMRTCLDKFHHSEFSDGVSYPRRINVELTAGGGGKTKQRQDKIKEKNRKLDENRAKRIERERTAKEENKGKGDTRKAGEDGIHPSRRAHIPGNRW